MAAKKPKQCKCIEDANRALVSCNARLQVAHALLRGITFPVLGIEKIDPKKRGTRPTLVPNYCPFCGALYPRAGS